MEESEGKNLKYSLVIFDFDGTLADTFPWLVSMIDRLADEFKFQRPSQTELESFRTVHARELMKQYNISFWKLLSMSRFVQKHMKKDIDQIELFPEIEKVIKDLHELGVKLALVTSNSLHNVEQVLGPEIMGLFEQLECGVSILGKTSKFKKVMKKTRVPPEDILCVGDEIRDLEAAQKAGLAFGAVTWGYTHPDVLRDNRPEELFASVFDITQVVAQA